MINHQRLSVLVNDFGNAFFVDRVNAREDILGQEAGTFVWLSPILGSGSGLNRSRFFFYLRFKKNFVNVETIRVYVFDRPTKYNLSLPGIQNRKRIVGIIGFVSI